MRTHNHLLRATSLVCTFLLLPKVGFAGQEGKVPASQPQSAKTIPPDQLESLVAPIALYPDPLLAQVFAASTYPLEIVQLQQWLEKHKDLKDTALAEAVKRENWDPSVQAMAGLPDVVKLLADNIKWCAELGDAFLAQQSGVMEAVQRMRTKAKDSGKLKSTEQMKVETRVIESKQVVVIEQADPQVVYVPSYNPTVVWGAPLYAYPPVYYPPAGYYAAGMAISFGVGVAMGAMWSGGWGWNTGWGGNNDININNNNNFNRNSNFNRSNVGSGNRNWQHNPQHRGGAPYSDRATAGRYSGTARGDSLSSRQANARQNAAQRSSGQGSFGNRSSAGGGDFGNRSGGGGRDVGGNRGGGGDRIGDRQIGGGGGSRSRSGNTFDGASRGGGAARSSGSRGASSFGGSRGGGGGGGFRGGGGGRRR